MNDRELLDDATQSERGLFEAWAVQRYANLGREGCGYADDNVHNSWLGWLARAPLAAADTFDQCAISKVVVSKSLLRPAISAANPLPPGCYCKPGRCAAPVIMGRQTPCRDPEKRDSKSGGSQV